MKHTPRKVSGTPIPAKKNGVFSLKARASSFAYALRGIWLLLSREHNAWIHLLATVGVVVAGIYFEVSEFEWCALVFAMGLVWTAEALNTAIEYLADALCPERNEAVGKAKDLAAAGVLLAAVAALIIGLLVLGPYVAEWFEK